MDCKKATAAVVLVSIDLGGRCLGGIRTLFPLEVLSLLIPFELVAHDVDDFGERFQGGLCIEEGEACAAGEHVDGRLGVFVTDGVADLAVDKGVELGDALAARGEALVGELAEGGDGPGAVAVGFRQVLGDFGLNAKALDERDEERLAEAVGADEADLVGLA